MKTTTGLKKVDVIYRRVDDDFWIHVFRSIAHLVCRDVCRLPKRKCGHRECHGNDVADDKAVYAYVPDMIRYYLNEEPNSKKCSHINSRSQKTRRWCLAKWTRW
jgi:uncharacterized circularly permuted ATP-grasp superfamily protein